MADIPFASIEKVLDHTKELLERVHQLTEMDVLVGVPASKGARQEGRITNAALAYIHNYGSPARNIPARPFIEPGILRIQREAVKILAEAGREVLEEGKSPRDKLAQLGMIAVSSVQNAILEPDPPFVPLKPETIRARLRKTRQGRRRLDEILAGGKQMGMTSAQALQSYAGAGWATGGAGMNIQPLIDTGQLRRSITYVIEGA